METQRKHIQLRWQVNQVMLVKILRMRDCLCFWLLSANELALPQLYFKIENV